MTIGQALSKPAIRRAKRAPSHMQMRFVYDTPSGFGGSFTVSILAKLPDNKCQVRVIYPTDDWNGYTFETSVDKLSNERRQRIDVRL